MNSDSRPSARQPHAPLEAERRWQVQAWRDLLDQCARKPSRRRIHALRSLTLRLQAALQYRLLEEAPNATDTRALNRWNKAGKKLRRALQPVRDADVYLARLDDLRGVREGPPDPEPQLSPSCLREIGKLEKRLKRRRQAGTIELIADIEAHRKRLVRLSKGLEAALMLPTPPAGRSTAQAAFDIFAGLSGEFPRLDSANLHAYRKRLKQALYLAELSAASDPLARRLAAAFRRIHAAAGEWHDWQMLALEARRVLPAHGEQDGLVPVLETLSEQALQRALGLCRRTAARLLREKDEIHPSPPRKPVASDPGNRPGEESMPLGISA